MWVQKKTTNTLASTLTMLRLVFALLNAGRHLGVTHNLKPEAEVVKTAPSHSLILSTELIHKT